MFLLVKEKKKAKKIKINLQIIFVNKLHDSIWLSVSNILSDFLLLLLKIANFKIKSSPEKGYFFGGIGLSRTQRYEESCSSLLSFCFTLDGRCCE